MIVRARAILILALMLPFQAGTAAPAAAAVITVDTLANEDNADGDCSLREAILAANTDDPRDGCSSGSGTDLIFVLLEGTISVPGIVGLPAITAALTIAGNANLTIDAAHGAPIFQVNMANAAHDFTLIGGGMRLRRGSALGRGGGALWLRKADRVSVQEVIFEENRACELLVVGACSASSDQEGNGGAIGFGGGAGELVNRLEVLDSIFANNLASSYGGALGLFWNDESDYLTTEVVIARSIFRANEALTGKGGALAVANNAPLRIERAVFLANRAKSGGAIYADGPISNPSLVVTNSLIVENEATETAAGLIGVGGLASIGRSLELSFTSIARNRTHTSTAAGGLYTLFSFSSITHTSITDHANGSNCINSNGSSLGFNLSSDGSCFFNHANDLAASSARLSGLGSFLGEELVALPSWWSPVVDGGNPSANPLVEGGTAVCLDAAGNPVTVDLLGNPRAANGDGNGGAECDVGAIEVQPPYAFLFGDGFEAGGSWAWD